MVSAKSALIFCHLLKNRQDEKMKSKDQKANLCIMLRANARLKERLQQAADKRGMPLATWIKMILVDELERRASVAGPVSVTPAEMPPAEMPRKGRDRSGSS
jgi:hypothetical protein